MDTHGIAEAVKISEVFMSGWDTSVIIINFQAGASLYRGLPVMTYTLVH